MTASRDGVRGLSGKETITVPVYVCMWCASVLVL